jgi:hypothetical protein
MALRHAPTMWVRWWLRVVPLAVLAMALSPVAAVRAASPVLAIESPADGSVSANPSPSFSGVTDDSFDEVALSIYEGPAVEGAPLQTLSAVPLSETWLAGPAATLPDGIYTAQASQMNGAPEEGVSAPVTFTVDTTPPEVSLTPLSAVTNDAEVSFGGAAGALTGDSSTVKLMLYAGGAPSGTPVETVEATREGNTWSVGPLLALDDGLYTARAEQADEAGNVGVSSPSTFTVDTVAPAPSLTAVATSSNDATPSFAGAVGVASGDLPEVTLKLYAGATASSGPLRTIDATVVAGEWNVGPLATLPDGVYTARAEQADEAGNVGFSSPSTFTVDTVAPAVSLSAPTSLTSDTTPTFEGKAGVATGDDPVVQVKVYAGATVSGSPVETIQATPATGSWSATPATPLADGVYTVEAIQSDEVGNTGVSVSFKFRLDTTAPAVALSAPLNGAMTDSSSQLVQGTAGTSEGDSQTITVELFEGSTIGAQEPVEAIVVKSVAGHWSTTFGGLAEGDYTVRADQSDSIGNLGKTQAVTFTVDQVAPVVSIAPVPAKISDNTPSFSGKAGSAAGDLSAVKLNLYNGSTVSASPVLTVDATLSAGAWAAGPLSALADGVYTVQAEQSDRAGNTGKSAAVTFTLEGPEPPPTEPTPTHTTSENPPQHAPPTASFTWFPPLPHTGEAVSVVSNSSDPYSPIATLAWGLESDPFKPGGGVFITTFTTPGQHAVRLRVTAADGLSGTVIKTIPVSSPPASLMQPFPIVRIAGANTKAGARLKLITVQAPAGAHITVACKGRGCPRKPESRVASSHKRGVVLVEFRRFERLVGAGSVLEIRIWKPGEIGKYTRFQIHKTGLPQRSDSCLNPSGTKPMTCPSS